MQEKQETEDKYSFLPPNFACVEDSVVKLRSEECAEIHRNVKGSLRRNIKLWRSIHTYDSVIDMIENGYKIPFIETPSPHFFKSSKSA